MNSFDEIQIEEDEAYAEWLWRHEMETREALDALDREDEAEMIDEINRLFDEAAK